MRPTIAGRAFIRYRIAALASSESPLPPTLSPTFSTLRITCPAPTSAPQVTLVPYAKGWLDKSWGGAGTRNWPMTGEACIDEGPNRDRGPSMRGLHRFKSRNRRMRLGCLSRSIVSLLREGFAEPLQGLQTRPWLLAFRSMRSCWITTSRPFSEVVGEAQCASLLSLTRLRSGPRSILRMRSARPLYRMRITRS